MKLAIVLSETVSEDYVQEIVDKLVSAELLPEANIDKVTLYEEHPMTQSVSTMLSHGLCEVEVAPKATIPDTVYERSVRIAKEVDGILVLGDRTSHTVLSSITQARLYGKMVWCNPDTDHEKITPVNHGVVLRDSGLPLQGN